MDICGQWGGGRRFGASLGADRVPRVTAVHLSIYLAIWTDTPKATRNPIERDEEKRKPLAAKERGWRGERKEEEFSHSAEHSAQSRFK